MLSADIEAHGHSGGFPGCAALASHGKATNPHNDECRERIKARMNAYKDRIADTVRVKDRKRARVERGAGDVPMEPRNRDDDRWRFDMRTQLAVTSHEPDRMRCIHVGLRGSEAAGEELLDKLRKTVRFEQDASSSCAAASSEPTVTLEYLASGETQDRPGSVLVQTSGHVDDDVLISELDAFHEMGGRKSRYFGEVLGRHRGEDAGNLKK